MRPARRRVFASRISPGILVLARAFRDDARRQLTRKGEYRGTQGWRAPEQLWYAQDSVDGSERAVTALALDQGADLFTLAATLHTGCAGAGPYDHGRPVVLSGGV